MTLALHQQVSAASKEIAQNWARMLFFPINVAAACEGKSDKSFLAESTGLSPAHLSTKGLTVKSEKRLAKVTLHGKERAYKNLREKGYSEEDAHHLIASCPETPLAGLVYRLGNAGPAPLRLATDFGARLDRLVEQAIKRVGANELAAYKRLVVDFLREERGDSIEQETKAEFDQLSHRILAARHWEDLQKPTDQLLQYILLAVLAAVDVEWSSRYFGRFLPTPTFFWLTPRFHPDFDLSNPKQLKRNIVARPTRKLLELLWTVTKRGTSKKNEWPLRPPGPSLLARDIAHVPTGDGVIRKWSSGAKHLHLDQVAELWASLQSNLLKEEAFELPLPWIAIALWMERALIRSKQNSSKAETVILLSEDSYQRIWTAHRERWATQLPQAGHLPWPKWLLDQPAWPE